jgi:hypothetical protein
VVVGLRTGREGVWATVGCGLIVWCFERLRPGRDFIWDVIDWAVMSVDERADVRLSEWWLGLVLWWWDVCSVVHS